MFNMLTRRVLIERAESYGYQVMVPGHGQDFYIRIDGSWEVIDDTLVEIPLIFIGHPQLSKDLMEYINTPIKYRQIIYPKMSFRVKDAMDELKTIGYEAILDDQGLLSVYSKGWRLLDINTKRFMTTHYHDTTEHHENEQYIEFLGIIYDLLQTSPKIRYWTYTYDEQLILARHPEARYLTRDKYTGGITLHQYKPYSYEGIFESEGAFTLEYDPSLFLYVNYSKRPFKI